MNGGQEDTATSMRHSWGDRVAKRRDELHFTQAQLADMVGLTERQLRRIEAGTSFPPEGTKFRLAGALRKRVGELFPYPSAVPPVPRDRVAS